MKDSPIKGMTLTFSDVPPRFSLEVFVSVSKESEKKLIETMRENGHSNTEIFDALMEQREMKKHD